MKKESLVLHTEQLANYAARVGIGMFVATAATVALELPHLMHAEHASHGEKGKHASHDSGSSEARLTRIEETGPHYISYGVSQRTPATSGSM